MERPLGSQEDFFRFQDYLREHGQIDLAALERKLTELLRLAPDGTVDFELLGKLLLLRYCIAWAVASSEDPPPLVEDEKCYEYERMRPHREQMARYAARYADGFSAKWRELLSDPETRFDSATGELMRQFVEREWRLAKGTVYMPALLFQEQIDLHVERDQIPEPASSKAALWGKDNIEDLLKGTPRARYWMDRLVRATGIGTGKAGKSKV